MTASVSTRHAGDTGPATSHATLTMWLTDPSATDAQVVGAKAAKLAAAAAAGLPTLPGFVLTTAASRVRDGRLEPAPGWAQQARPMWERLTDTGTRPLIVRSSSTVEDAETSSMAGRFLSVLDVHGWDAFVASVTRVLESANADAGPVRPMAVLVQPLLDAAIGGVLFGIDPVTGNPRHVVVEAVEGSPEDLVSGRVTAVRYVLDRRGRLLETDDAGHDRLLDRNRRRRLGRLARRTRAVFAGPQDVEWAFDHEDRLFLLQSRPVTATGDGARATGPVLGPGPVGETFPDPLRPLEVDLWVEPLRRGVVGALRVSGAAPDSALTASPVILSVAGRVAADLELLGVQRERPSPLARLDPRGPARHLAVAWRVGRLRAALPGLVDDLLDVVDADLVAVPALTSLTTSQLVGLIGRARVSLASVHGYEVLAGMLLTDRRTGTGAGLAMRLLAHTRAEGRTDPEAVADHPSILALSPPRLGGMGQLPDVAPGTEHVRPAPLSRRELLRLRARWLQELQARAADELGRRLTDRGVLDRRDDVAWLQLPELVAVVDRGGALPADLDQRRQREVVPPLPAAFRLTASGEIAPTPAAGEEHEGRGAGGGRGDGTARTLADLPDLQPGEVLVVPTLEPRLAAVLPDLAGLVCETGSTLSHLAILARELGVPTVVGVRDAQARFPTGSVLLVDGTTGEVTVQEVAP